MKKLISIVLALILILALTALSESALTATEKAVSYAPKNAQYLYTEKDGAYYEVHFLSADGREEFEITVPVSGGTPLKLETDSEGEKGSAVNTLSDEEAKSAVLWEYPDCEIDSILRVKEDGLFEVHVYFKNESLHGLIEMNAETGLILERKVIFLAPGENWQLSLSEDYQKDAAGSASVSEASAKNSAPASNASSSSASAYDRISVSQAKSVITSRYPGAKIKEIELDKEKGKYVYEGEAVYNGKEYDFEIDASTGKLRQWELDD